MDERERYAGPDRIAYLLVPTFFKLLIKLKWPFDLFKRFFFAKGIYEYVIARTRYFDAVFIDSLEKGFDQIVIFGAGFDSRALRFHYLNKGNTILFELDAPITQQNKLKAYLSKGLFIPQNLVFVPIDFNKESLAEKTAGAGFIAGKKTLFMLEGVTMYLSQDAIQSTFRFIADVSAKGSMIVFDYIYGGVLRKENRLYGEKNIYKTVAASARSGRLPLKRTRLLSSWTSTGSSKMTTAAHQSSKTGFSGIPAALWQGRSTVLTRS